MHLSPTMAKADVRSKAVVLMFLIHCFMHLPLFLRVLCLVVFCMHYFVPFLGLQSSGRGRESWLLYFNCLCDVWFLFMFCDSSSWWRCVIVVFPDHTHLLFKYPNILHIYMYIQMKSLIEALVHLSIYMYVPVHEILVLITSANNEVSEEPSHPCSLEYTKHT